MLYKALMLISNVYHPFLKETYLLGPKWLRHHVVGIYFHVLYNLVPINSCPKSVSLISLVLLLFL